MYSISDILYFIKRKIYPGFKAKKGGLVIDIGSGDKPLWRADVFFDNLSLKNNQRFTNSETVHDLGLFVNGDVTKMPFKDKVFDFSFCAHLLEHVEDPELAINEIMRISKCGYIEVPNGLIDSIKPFPSHLWLIYENDLKLIFVRKDKFLSNVMEKNGEQYHHLIKKTKDPFIRLYWKDKISYKIINDLLEENQFTVDQKEGNNKIARNYYLILIKILRHLFYIKKDFKLSDLIR